MKKVLLGIVGLFVLVLLAVAGTVAWKSRDIAATHPTLAAAELPQLIPVRDFYADRKGEWDYVTDPTGTYIAWRATRKTKEVVLLARLDDRKEIARFDNVNRHFFDDLGRGLTIIRKGRMWLIDPKAPAQENWQDITPRGFSNWRLGNRTTNPDIPQVVSSRDRNPSFADLYTVNKQGGDKKLLIRNEGQTLYWLLDATLKPILRADKETENMLTFRHPVDGEWRETLTVSINERFQPLAIGPDDQSIFAVSARGRDKAALVQFDLTTAEETVIVSEPDEDINGIVDLDLYDGQIDAVLTHVGDNHIVPLSPRGETLRKLIEAEGDRVYVEPLKWSGGGRYVTASLSPEGKNFVYRLFDLDKETAVDLGIFSFRQKHGAAIVTAQEVSIPARDGMELHALLTRPKGVDEPTPTIISIHGGPALMKPWRYDHFRQFLANRGYAVLTVNFRGSAGFGKIYQKAGFGEVGRAMQDDIADAAKWAIDQGIADPAAIAAMGGSYGGYSAAMSVLRDPDLFKAAIIEHAVLDLPYQMRNNPFAWGLTPEYMVRYFGDPEDPDQLAAMKKVSPQELADRLDAPILLIAGKRDGVVGFEQTEAFAKKARKTGSEVETLIFEDEGHGMHRWQSRVRHARHVEDFLAKHLGGRSGGWDWIELPAEYLD